MFLIGCTVLLDILYISAIQVPFSYYYYYYYYYLHMYYYYYCFKSDTDGMWQDSSSSIN